MFAALSDDDCDAVLRLLKARRGGPGHTLFHQGDTGSTLMILVEGQLQATVTAPDGSQALLQVISPGQVVGELAFLDESRRSTTVTTSTGAVVLEFSRDALLVLCRDHPRVGAILQRTLLSNLARRVRVIEEALGSLNATSARPASVRPPGVRPPSVRPPSMSPPSSRPSSRARSEGRESLVPASVRPRGRTVTAEQLRGFAVLGSHSAEDLELLAYMATLRRFECGEVMIRPGTEEDAAFLILDGSVEVSRANMSIAVLEAGGLVGHLALLDRALRPLTVTAVTETSALELKADVFSNLMKASSPLALRFQRDVAIAVARHLRAACEQFAAMSGAGPNRLALHEIDIDGIDGDWSTGSDEPIELDLDPGVLRR